MPLMTSCTKPNVQLCNLVDISNDLCLQYDELVNANHPMFWEIGKLGKSYMDWIFTPEDKDLRFFGSDFLESLTQCQWYIIPIFWLPVIFFHLHLSFSNFMGSGGYETWLSQVAGGRCK